MNTDPTLTAKESETRWKTAILSALVSGIILGCIFAFIRLRQGPLGWLIFGLFMAPAYAVKPRGRRWAAVAIAIVTGAVLAAILRTLLE
jgi:hypothetical protein